MITARDFIKIVPKSYKIDFYKEHGEYVYDSKINEDDENSIDKTTENEKTQE